VHLIGGKYGNILIEKIRKWFETNSLILKFNKTHYMQFMTKPKLAVHIYVLAIWLTLSITPVAQTSWVAPWIAHYHGKHISNN
jgi:hypothetical protein